MDSFCREGGDTFFFRAVTYGILCMHTVQQFCLNVLNQFSKTAWTLVLAAHVYINMLRADRKWILKRIKILIQQTFL